MPTPTGWRVRDGQPVTQGDEAVAVLVELLEAGRRDVSFIRGVDRSLQVVTNGQRAMLVLWGREGFDQGIYAVDPSASDNPHHGFILENGQADSYAGNETVPLDQALEAVRYAIDHDEPDPRLRWLRW